MAVAVLSLGAVINPLLPNYRERELAQVFETARPAAVFTPGEFRGCDHRELVAQVVAATGVAPLHVVVDAEASARRGHLRRRCSPRVRRRRARRPPAAAVSELIFTSGTEARPKAIMHTEQTADFSVRVARADLGVTDDDVVWMPSPVGHSTGFNYGLRFALHHGLPLVLQDRWDAATALRPRAGARLLPTRSPPPPSSRTSPRRPPRPAPASTRCGSSAAAARRCRRRWSTPPPRSASRCCASTARPRCSSARGTGRGRRPPRSATPTAWP